MRLREQLLTVSEAYAKAVGRSEARVSTIVYGAGNALLRLREGCDMGSERIHNGLQWFSDNWPEDAAWPAAVPRPVAVAAAPVAIASTHRPEALAS